MNWFLIDLYLIKIFEEKPQFAKFTGLINPEEERSGLIYDPVEVDVYLQVRYFKKFVLNWSQPSQVKAINEINLNEEYMDASIVITMEWIDKQLNWIDKKNLKTCEISTTPIFSTPSLSQNNTAENDTAQNSTNTSQDAKERD